MIREHAAQCIDCLLSSSIELANHSNYYSVKMLRDGKCSRMPDIRRIRTLLLFVESGFALHTEKDVNQPAHCAGMVWMDRKDSSEEPVRE
jgi:hypothetical protein